MSQTQGKTQPQEERKVSQTAGSPTRQPQEQKPGFEVFVKSLPFSATEEEVKAFFEGCGAIENVYLLRGRDRRPKGSGFVRFVNKESVAKAVAKNNSELGGRALTIEEAKPREERPAQPRESKTSTSVFIGNLSYTTTEDQLRSHFEGAGAIKAIRLATDRNGQSKGFAHIDFETEEQAGKAVQKSASELDGRTLRVDYANPNGPRTGGRGGFRGGRGSFRGSRGGSRGGFRGGFRGDFRGEFRGDREGTSRGGSRGGRGGFSTRGGSRGGDREGPRDGPRGGDRF